MAQARKNSPCFLLGTSPIRIGIPLNENRQGPRLFSLSEGQYSSVLEQTFDHKNFEEFIDRSAGGRQRIGDDPISGVCCQPLRDEQPYFSVSTRTAFIASTTCRRGGAQSQQEVTLQHTVGAKNHIMKLDFTFQQKARPETLCVKRLCCP